MRWYKTASDLSDPNHPVWAEWYVYQGANWNYPFEGDEGARASRALEAFRYEATLRAHKAKDEEEIKASIEMLQRYLDGLERLSQLRTDLSPGDRPTTRSGPIRRLIADLTEALKSVEGLPFEMQQPIYDADKKQRDWARDFPNRGFYSG